jgi:hypothetical protein
MDETQVKAVVLTRLREIYSREAKPLVTSEFVLGSSGVRADLAVFADRLLGIEIKTARDTLRRLPSQMKAYSKYFEEVVLVLASCHARNVDETKLWGAAVWTYDDSGALSVISEGRRNAVSDDSRSDILSKAELRRGCFSEAMISRYSDTSQQFWKRVRRRSAVRPEDLILLSRFAENRERARLWEAERASRWSSWIAAQEEIAGTLA